MAKEIMTKEIQYQVLWMDDQPEDEFIDFAFENNLNITVATCYEEGVKLLKDPQTNWDALILDANYKRTDDPNETPDRKNLTDVIAAINKSTNGEEEIPWFVYTGGTFEKEEDLTVLIPSDKSWESKKYYKKPLDRACLFEDIKKAVAERETTQLKQKYAEAWCVYPNNDLFKLLGAIENCENNDASLLNDIRKIIEWIMKYCNSHGVLPLPFNGSNISACSRFLGDRNLSEIVPFYVQRSLQACVEVTNDGSHRLKADNAVKSGKAPFLLRSTALELLNILVWCGTLPQKQEEIEMLTKEVSHSLLEEELVEQDGSRNYHCGKFLIPYRKGAEKLGKKITIKKCSCNSNVHTKEQYPYFIQDFE